MKEHNNPHKKNIVCTMEGKIAIFTMNRPEALNALDDQTLEELELLLQWAGEQEQVGGVIITGKGKAFVAGADISQMRDYGAREGRDYAARAQGVFNQIERLEKPVLAAVNGYALGGGCELAMACDLRIASEKAIFGQPEGKLGVIPCFGGTQRLPRLIGIARAKELIFTGRQVKAEEALLFGLVNHVTEPHKLMEISLEMMETILEMAPLALAYAKVAIQGGVEMELSRALDFERDVAALTFGTEDKQEGMAAFLEKRKPIFKKK